MKHAISSFLAVTVGVIATGIAACTPIQRDRPIAQSCANLQPGRQILPVESAGATRPVLVFAPTGARGQVPLVIDLHGSGSNGEEQSRLSRLSQLGASEGFIVANPSGSLALEKAPQRHFWNIPGVPLVNGGAGVIGNPADEVQFIRDLIGQLESQGCVDPRRVYVTGMSGGGRMTSLLACELSGQIAAVAPVAGLRAGLPNSSNPQMPDVASCRASRPVPIVTFHGTSDVVNPYAGGGTAYWRYSIPVALQRWAELNHCDPTAVETKISAHVSRLSYRHCAARSELVLYRIDASAVQGGGHSWPGAAPATDATATNGPSGAGANLPSAEIDASALMWAFFQRHRLARDPR